MTSHWDQTLQTMYRTSLKMRTRFPAVGACKDEQLFELLKDTESKWLANDKLLRSGATMTGDDTEFGYKSWDSILVEQCCYYETLMDQIEYEISRRPWLATATATDATSDGQ
jgi:hypothetical protein